MVDVETVMTGICDEFGPAAQKRRFPILILVVSVFFLLGIPQCCQVVFRLKLECLAKHTPITKKMFLSQGRFLFPKNVHLLHR